MYIEFNQTKIWNKRNTFISQYNLPVDWDTCPIVWQAPENQLREILWADVRAKR
jgi:hypothetical protein